jgi:hypothetical protein
MCSDFFVLEKIWTEERTCERRSAVPGVIRRNLCYEAVRHGGRTGNRIGLSIYHLFNLQIRSIFQIEALVGRITSFIFLYNSSYNSLLRWLIFFQSLSIFPDIQFLPSSMLMFISL